MTEMYFCNLMDLLDEAGFLHSPKNSTYVCLSSLTKKQAQCIFGELGPCNAHFGEIGDIALPYFKMGNISSVNLFDLDELILFKFYSRSKAKYKNVADIGANLGLHSLVLSRLGFSVKCYEPDPHHYEQLLKNLQKNNVSDVNAINKAVSSKVGTADFIRVLGNTTGSHLDGAKESVYGEVSKFQVELAAFKDVMRWADFAKIDVEGHEAEILESTNEVDWAEFDAMVEVGSEVNAERIFHHLSALSISMYSQMTGWSKVTTIKEMPFSYKDGSLFISKNDIPFEVLGK